MSCFHQHPGPPPLFTRLTVFGYQWDTDSFEWMPIYLRWLSKGILCPPSPRPLFLSRRGLQGVPLTGESCLPKQRHQLLCSSPCHLWLGHQIRLTPVPLLHLLGVRDGGYLSSVYAFPAPISKGFKNDRETRWSVKYQNARNRILDLGMRVHNLLSCSSAPVASEAGTVVDPC